MSFNDILFQMTLIAPNPAHVCQHVVQHVIVINRKIINYVIASLVKLFKNKLF